MEFRIHNYGAVADGKTINTAAIQAAIDACHAAGGGRVTVSNGVYMTGSITLRSHVELHIAAGGVLLGSPSCADYPEKTGLRHVVSERLPRRRNASLIFAEEAENISLTGSGVIDCNGTSFVKERSADKPAWYGWEYERIDAPTPPRVVFFAGCRNVKIEDVTMQNQPSGWSYWISDCDCVTFDKIKIMADVRYPNNDGIHINSSRNVTVSNSCITCGDDCIVVRANNISLAENKVCEKVTVTNCNLTSYSSGIRIGWQNDGVIRNCSFSNLIMTDTTTGIGIYLPYQEPDVPDQGREATHVENLLFQDIVMDRIASLPIQIYIDPRPEVRCSAIRNIFFRNLHISGPFLPRIVGREENPIENISFSDCSFTMTDGQEFEDLSRHGVRLFQGYQPMEMRFTKNISFHNTRFEVNR